MAPPRCARAAALALWTPLTKPELWNDYLLPGLLATLKAALFSIVLAAIFGFVMALLRLSDVKALRWIAGVVVEFFRAVPVLLMMIFTWGIMIEPLGSERASFWGVVAALTLYNGAVLCEVIRSGVDQLLNGQREAGLSLGLTSSRTLRMILLPQAVTAMLPTLVSQLVVVLKDTALGYNIMYGELLNSAKDAGSNYQNMLPTLLLVALVYIVVNYLVTKLAELLERRIKSRGHTAGSPDAHGGPPAVGVDAGAGLAANSHQ